MKTLKDLEKKINSELTTKINESRIHHNQLYLISDLFILVVNSELIFFSRSVKLFMII